MNIKLEKYRILSDLTLTHKVIKMLLAVLPDSIRDYDPSWEYCWNELSDDAQEQVVEARHEAMQLLKRSAGSGSEAEPNPACGHPLSSIVSSDEGTCYCSECEREAR